MTGSPHLSATTGVGRRRRVSGPARWSLGRAGLTAAPADQAKEKEGRQRTFGSWAANEIGPEEWKGKEKGLPKKKGFLNK
jgi:hypothetical protein